ncbi:hypothetical protein AC1031_015968 [Aphanomyces cochlioides]|nr:hypothetical protein AC1031_015968 [Aphanomyces cochlioides]
MIHITHTTRESTGQLQDAAKKNITGSLVCPYFRKSSHALRKPTRRYSYFPWQRCEEDAYAANDPLKDNTKIKRYGKSMTKALVVVAIGPFENELTAFEWKEPMPLCTTSGKDWRYQGADEVAASLASPLSENYEAWKDERMNKKSRPLPVELSGSSTGKSRMLDEMKKLLCIAAAEVVKDDSLATRLKSAFEFRLDFNHGSEPIEILNPEFDVSCRMLYQLSKVSKEPWIVFYYRWKNLSRFLRIEQVMDVLAQLQAIDNVEDMTVIICVDGLQNLHDDSRTTSAMHSVLDSIYHFVNTSRAFVVCVCAATIYEPVDEVLENTSQRFLHLHPPPLRGEKVIAASDRATRQLIEDMGGHGGVLEALEDVLKKHKGSQAGPSSLINGVCRMILVRYDKLLNAQTFDDPTLCKYVLATVLSRRKCCATTKVSHTDWTGNARNVLSLYL